MSTGELPEPSFADIAVALNIEARHNARSDSVLEVLILQLRLTTPELVLAEAKKQTDLIVAAHRVFKLMGEHEAEVRAFLATLDRGIYHGLRREAA